MSLPELRILAKSLGIKGASSVRKQELVTLIEQYQSDKDMKKDPVHDTHRVEDKVQVQVQSQDQVQSQVQVHHKRTPSKWNTFLAEYRKEHSCSLKEAMCKKEEYAMWKSKA